MSPNFGSMEPVSSAVCATNFLYKLCGSSQPSILGASDGAFYVVKFNGFPGSQGLANEVVGSELIRKIGLAAPSWTMINVSRDFINAHPDMWFFKDGSTPIRPRPGLHFASRVIEATGEQRTYQMIPHSWIVRIENRADFLGILALDLWTNNCDRRQAVFLSGPRNRLHASFIDNDFMFGGKFGSDMTCPRRTMFYDLGIYKDLWSKAAVCSWIEKIDGISDQTTRDIVLSIPDAWASRCTRLEIIKLLRNRRSKLPSMLNEAREVANTGYSLQYQRTRNATEPCLIGVASLRP